MDRATWFIEQLETRLPTLTGRFVRYLWDIPERNLVTPVQSFVLDLLHAHGRCSAGMLAELLGVTSAPVTAVTKRMLDRGWINRVLDADDRRMVWFTLTELGQKVRTTMAERRRAKWRAVVEQVGQSKAQQLIDLMSEFERALESVETGKP